MWGGTQQRRINTYIHLEYYTTSAPFMFTRSPYQNLWGGWRGRSTQDIIIEDQVRQTVPAKFLPHDLPQPLKGKTCSFTLSNARKICCKHHICISPSPLSHLLQFIMMSSGWILFFSMPCLGCSPLPRNRPGGSILKLPMRSLWWSSRQYPNSSTIFWLASFNAYWNDKWWNCIY